MANHTTSRWFISGAALLLSVASSMGADTSGNLIINGGFEAGMQIWKGDGKIVLLPEGNRVCEIEASKSRMKDIKQEFRMKQLQQVEIIFRARSMKYTGPGLRISVHQNAGGSIIWNRELPEDGSWREYRLVYTRAGGNIDARVLNIATLIGTGSVQIDDVEVREPSKVVENQPPQPVPPPPTSTPMPEVKPPAPVAIAKAPTPPAPVAPAPSAPIRPSPALSPGTYGSLAQIMGSIPADSLRKLQNPETADAAVAEINDYFKQNVKNKPAQLRVHVAAGEVPPNGANKYRIRATDQPAMSWEGGSANGHMWVYFPEATVPPEGTTPVGSDITVSGLLGRCDLTNKGRIQLNIDLEKAKVVNP